VKEVVKYACSNFEKASILSIVKGEDVIIVFNYNNYSVYGLRACGHL